VCPLDATLASLRFSPPHEHPEPDEAILPAGIDAQLRRIREKTVADGGLVFGPPHRAATRRRLGGVTRVCEGAREAAQRFRAENDQRALSEPKAIVDIGL